MKISGINPEAQIFKNKQTKKLPNRKRTTWLSWIDWKISTTFRLFGDESLIHKNEANKKLLNTNKNLKRMSKKGNKTSIPHDSAMSNVYKVITK